MSLQFAVRCLENCDWVMSVAEFESSAAADELRVGPFRGLPETCRCHFHSNWLVVPNENSPRVVVGPLVHIRTMSQDSDIQ